MSFFCLENRSHTCLTMYHQVLDPVRSIRSSKKPCSRCNMVKLKFMGLKTPKTIPCSAPDPPGVLPVTWVLHLNNRWAMEHHQKLMQKCHKLLVTSSILLCLVQLVCVLCKIFECTPVHGSSALSTMPAFLWSSIISWYWLVIFGALSVFNLAYSPVPSIRCTDRRHFVSRSFIATPNRCGYLQVSNTVWNYW